MIDPETRAVLLKARELIATKGWCQGEYYAMDGSVCAIGALWDGWNNFFMKTPPSVVAAMQTLTDMSDDQRPFGLVRWNDKPGRNVEEVLALFDRALEAK